MVTGQEWMAHGAKRLWGPRGTYDLAAPKLSVEGVEGQLIWRTHGKSTLYVAAVGIKMGTGG